MPAALDMRRHSESYEHIGEVGMWVHDLERRWQQEEERQRIARELHDQLGQYFAVLLLGLDTAKRACRSKETADGAIDELKTLALSMNREVHQLAWELRPARVIVETCTLDGAAALPNYLARGFQVVREERVWRSITT